MNNKFENKIVAITGGCRGIGKAIATRFAEEGAFVYALDFKLPEENEVFISDEKLAANVKCIQVDVTNFESVTKAFQQIIDEKSRIDVLVNNAGITRDNLVLKMSEMEWDSVLNTNLKGAFLCSKAVSRQMMGQRNGRIINIGSIVGSIGNAGQANYSASKAGLIGLTKSFAKEFGSRNILVNCVAPGYVITDMTDKLTDEQKQQFLKNIPLKRGATPLDISNAVLFLASEEASYITGQLLTVDGGMTM